MAKPLKVVWSEGMFLTPQHFQYWDRYHEMLLSTRLGPLAPFGWGVADLDIDREGLANGTFSVLGLRGLMPDGIWIEIPDPDPAPETRPVGDLFPPSLDHLDVFLGIPVERPEAANYRLEETAGSRSTRFIGEYIKVPDQITGSNVREITVARKNLRLFFSGEEMTDHTTLKIAELVRTPGGSICLREGYIPAALCASGSPHLMKLIRGLLEALSAKRGFLAAQLGSGDPDPVRFSLFYTLNSAIPLLSHISQLGRIHPEGVYLVLARLAGELTSFSPEIQPRDLPPYDHGDLSKTFSTLDQRIRAMVEGVTPIRDSVIPLEKTKEHVWMARIADERILASSQLFLAVSGEIPQEQIREWVPRRIKVGSAGDVEVLIASAMPGLRLQYTPRPPAGLSVKAGHQYFRLENQGEFWDSICRSRSIGFYIPGDLKGLNLELLAVKEST